MARGAERASICEPEPALNDSVELESLPWDVPPLIVSLLFPA